MLVGRFVKDPEAVLDYYMNWTVWLAGDTISTSTWIATGSVTIRDPGLSGDVASIWVEGGTAGELIDLTNHIVTAAGREDERTLRLILQD